MRLLTLLSVWPNSPIMLLLLLQQYLKLQLKYDLNYDLMFDVLSFYSCIYIFSQYKPLLLLLTDNRKGLDFKWQLQLLNLNYVCVL